MNDLGILLVWSASRRRCRPWRPRQCTCSRPGGKPATGAAVAAAGLGGCLPHAAGLCPLPSWWDWRPPSRPPRRPAEAAAADPPCGRVAARRRDAGRAADGPAWPVDLTRPPGRGRAARPPRSRIGPKADGRSRRSLLAGAAFGLLRFAGGLWAVSGLRRRSRLVLDDPFSVHATIARGNGLSQAGGTPGMSRPRGARRGRLAAARGAAAGGLARLERGRTPRRAGPRTGPRPPLGLSARPAGPARPRSAFLSPAAVLAGRPVAAATGAGRRRPGRPARRRTRRLPAGPGPAGAAAQRSSPGGLARQPALFPRNADKENSDAEDQGWSFSRPAPRWGRAVAVVLAAAVVGASALRCPAQKAGEAGRSPPSLRRWRHSR